MIKLDYDEDKIFFSSDHHFLHTKVIEYSGRPFKSIEEHDNTLIANINSRVGKNDYLFLGGDFIFNGNLEVIEEYYNRINGIKFLILGNHCIQNKMYRQSVVDIFKGRVYDSITLSVHGIIYYVTHFPYQYFTGINIHGHIHSGPNSKSNEYLPLRYNQYDMGVDNNNYYPPSLTEIKEKLYGRT